MSNTNISNINILKKNECIKTIDNNEIESIHPLINSILISTDNKSKLCFVLPQFIDNECLFARNYNILLNESMQLNSDLEINLDFKKDSKTDIKISNESNKLGSNELESNLDTDTDSDSDLNLEFDLELDQDNISNPNKDNLSKSNICNSNCIDPLLYFTLPINSNNFLDLIFNITTIEHLNEWLNYYETLIIDDYDIFNINLVLDLFWKNYYNIINQNINSFINLNQKIIKIMFNKNIDIKIIEKISNKIIEVNYGKKIKYIDEIKKYLTKYI
jgi:hypothetical protein